MIISVSRKTDIPAFYHEWFFKRLQAGYVLSKNPFNAHQINVVSLKPEDVDAFVFWTRNPEHLMQRLGELEDYCYYFQYTITGYPRALEKSTPNPHRAIETFQQLSQTIGKEKVIWRYDPILLSNIVGIQEHKRLFAKIADALSGYTDKVIISFADFYAKTERNLKKIEIKPISPQSEHNLFRFFDILKPEHERELKELVQFMLETAQKHHMKIETCAESVDLKFKYQIEGIERGKCVDNVLLDKISRSKGKNFSKAKDKGQRSECGCVVSKDIGIYDTCTHGCQYCYATTRHNIAIENKRKHNPNSPFLIGEIQDLPPDVQEKINRQINDFLNEPKQSSLFG